MVSPNELHKAACDFYLGGKEPSTQREWSLVVNFWAANVEKSVAVPAIVLMAKIMDCPLPEATVREIAEFQSSPERKHEEVKGHTQSRSVK